MTTGNKKPVDVKVNPSLCNVDSLCIDFICVDVCPDGVFELQEIPEYPGEKKSVVVNNDACTACGACEDACPMHAITVDESLKEGNIMKKVHGEGPTLEREIVIEKEVVVKIRCSYCGNVYDETLDACPNCGGKR